MDDHQAEAWKAAYYISMSVHRVTDEAPNDIGRAMSGTL